MLETQLVLMARQDMSRSRSDRRSDKRLALFAIDIERHAWPRSKLLDTFVLESSGHELRCFVVYDVVRAVNTQVLDVGVVSVPITPIEIGEEAKLGQFVWIGFAAPVLLVGDGYAG